jgi:hypothetical protein
MNIEDVLKGHGIGVGGSNIKSIQRGSITPFNNTTATTATITISPIKKIIQS